MALEINLHAQSMEGVIWKSTFTRSPESPKCKKRLLRDEGVDGGVAVIISFKI